MSRSIAPWAVVALLAAGCAPAQPIAVSAAPSATLQGETKALFGADASSWATTDAANAIATVGVTLAAASIDAAPTDAAAKPSTVELLMPDRVRKETFLDHLSLDWNPQGHDPAGTYNVPHFDFHFYNMTSDQVKAVDCSDKTAVPTARIPNGFALLPPPNGQCVPHMGIHASDLSSPELAPNNPAKFTKTMILGYYAGGPTFIEPMVTQAYLQGHQDFSVTVPVPGEVGKSTLWPTTFNAKFDAGAKTYTLVFGGFKAVK